jgi:hypothetical protein
MPLLRACASVPLYVAQRVVVTQVTTIISAEEEQLVVGVITPEHFAVDRKIDANNGRFTVQTSCDELMVLMNPVEVYDTLRSRDGKTLAICRIL